MSRYVLELKHKLAVWQGYGLIEPLGHRPVGASVLLSAMGVIRPIGRAEADDRTKADLRGLTEKLRVATTGRFPITTDGWGPYPDSIKYSLGTRVDFAKVIKVYRSGTQGEGRYSPAEIVSTEVVPVMGRPNHKRICTSHIERQNLSIRMGMRRMTRLTKGFRDHIWSVRELVGTI